MKSSCKQRIGLLLLLLLLPVCRVASENELGRFEKVDVDVILRSDRLFYYYVACIIYDGPCTADGRAVKQILPEALKNSCAECNDKHRTIIRKIVSFVKGEKPEVWHEFNEKYNAGGEYSQLLVEFE